MKKVFSIVSFILLFNSISTAGTEEIKKPSLTHVMTYVLQWDEKEVGLVEKIGEGRAIWPLTGYVVMADGTKGKIVGQTADWNNGISDNGRLMVDVRASVKLENGDFFHLRYEGRLSFTEEGQKKFGTQEHLIPNKEFYLLSVGHMYTKSKKYSSMHQSGIVLKGVDFVWPSTADGDKRGELKYEIFKATP